MKEPKIKAWGNQEKCSQTTFLTSGLLRSLTCDLIIWIMKQAVCDYRKCQNQLHVCQHGPRNSPVVLRNKTELSGLA